MIPLFLVVFSCARCKYAHYSIRLRIYSKYHSWIESIRKMMHRWFIIYILHYYKYNASSSQQHTMVAWPTCHALWKTYKQFAYKTAAYIWFSETRWIVGLLQMFRSLYNVFGYEPEHHDKVMYSRASLHTNNRQQHLCNFSSSISINSILSFDEWNYIRISKRWSFFDWIQNIPPGDPNITRSLNWNIFSNCSFAFVGWRHNDYISCAITIIII